jgi:tetratricopeptide (TPR) repeat protein
LASPGKRSRRPSGQPPFCANAARTDCHIRCSSLGLVFADSEPDRARDVLEEALEIAEATGDRAAAVEALHNRGELERDHGNLEVARVLMERALSEASTIDFPRAPILHGLGDLALDRGDVTEARLNYVDAFREGVNAHLALPTALAVAGLAAVYSLEDRPMEAGLLWGAVQAMTERLGHSFGVTASAAERTRYEHLLPPPDDPDFARSVEEGRVGDPLPIVETVLGSAS